MAYAMTGYPGKITMDLPTTNYIYELPLFEIGDIHGPLNVSLVFNRERKDKGDNPFSLDAGYKLNVQKKLIMEDGAPSAILDANGNETALFGSDGLFTFDDESQRILKRMNQSASPSYVVEHPDYSLEYYTSAGLLDSVVDKYGVQVFRFVYDANQRLTQFVYRNSKIFVCSYTSGRLSMIRYSNANCSVSFSYSGNQVTVNHYSAEQYRLIYDGSAEQGGSGSVVEFYADAINGGRSVKLKKQNCTVTVCEYLGTTEVNRQIFEFPTTVMWQAIHAFDVVDVIDKLGVKTRMQYDSGRRMYSYEVTGDDVEFFGDNIYPGNVQIYRTADNIFCSQAVGTLTKDDGVPMSYTENAGEGLWRYDASFYTGTDPKIGLYTLTGWTKRKVEDDVKITISGCSNGLQYNYVPDQARDEKWKFFAYRFYADAAFINVFVSVAEALDTKDFRLTFQKTGVIAEDDKSHIRMSGPYLTNGTRNIPFEEAVFFHTVNGTNTVISDVTVPDVLRYKLKRKRDGQANEMYFDNSYGVVGNVTQLKFEYDGQSYSAANFNVMTKTYVNRNEHIQKTYINETSQTAEIVVENYVGNALQSTQKLNSAMDTVQTVANGITTTYTRDASGLITSETVTDAQNNVLYNRTTAYGQDASGNPTVTVTDEFGESTVYTMDPIWGVVTSVALPDGSTIVDNYDDDGCVKTGRVFQNTTPRTIGYGQTNGNLTRLSSGGLTYNFTYTGDDLTGVSKNDTQIEQHICTDTTTESYYPTLSNTVHSSRTAYDKYGRLVSIDEVLTNEYDVEPFFESNGTLHAHFNNGNAHLAMTTDEVMDETARFLYDRGGRLIEKTVTDKTDYSDKVSTEMFAYDAIGRLTNHGAIYDEANSRSVSDVITYQKAANATGADGTVRSHTYRADDVLKVTTTNTLDALHRLSSKNVVITGYPFKKNFIYDKTRISSASDTRSGVNLGTNSYTYDEVGRIKTNFYSSAKSSSSHKSYEYDKFGQLIRENNNALAKTYLYEYNDIGNLTSVKAYSYTTGDVSGTPVTTTFGYTDDKLTAFGGKTIAYNAMGCPTSYEGKNCIWSKGRLSRMTKGTLATGTESYAYTYNGFGQRVSKSYSYLEGTSSTSYVGQLLSSSKKFFYDHSGRLIAETVTKNYKGTGEESEHILFLYDGNTVVGMERAVGSTLTRYYFQRNLQGDVEAIYDLGGNLKAKYIYDAWGNCTISSETTDYAVANANPIRYRGYYYDDDTGLYYCNARYYSPKWRRFISPSTSEINPSAVNGLNTYIYANNNPINMVDNNLEHVDNSKGLAESIALRKPVFSELEKKTFNFSLSKSNYVIMTHYTTSLFTNAVIGRLFGNVSYTVTTQLNEAGAIYSYRNVGNGGVSYGMNKNWSDWYGRSVYVSSNLGVGSSVQLTPWFTYGSELSVLDGITLSAGIISGNTTHELSLNIGWGTIGAYAVATAMAAIPIPGARALAGVAACIILFVDILN